MYNNLETLSKIWKNQTVIITDKNHEHFDKIGIITSIFEIKDLEQIIFRVEGEEFSIIIKKEKNKDFPFSIYEESEKLENEFNKKDLLCLYMTLKQKDANEKEFNSLYNQLIQMKNGG